jgi:hypothetical protein
VLMVHLWMPMQKSIDKTDTSFKSLFVTTELHSFPGNIFPPNFLAGI